MSQPTTERPSHSRLAFIVLLLASALLVYVFRAYQLTVARAEEHLSRMDWTSQSVERQHGPRGDILDAQGRILATDVDLRDVFIDARHLREHESHHADAIRAVLVRNTDLDPAEFERWLTTDDLDSLPRFARVARDLSLRDAQELIAPLRRTRDECDDASADLPCPLHVRAVGLSPHHQRVYPFGSTAAPVLGFVNRMHQGGAGLEGLLDGTLRGRELEVVYQRNTFRAGILQGALPDLDTAAGETVVLTLDARLQSTAERALAQTLEAFEAEAGVVVASDPATGAVLAMASLPANDPVEFNDGPEAFWLHRAVSHVYEPGSTAKIFAFATAIEEGVIDYDTTFDCNNGVYFVGGRLKLDHYCHDEITAWQTIQKSSNIGAIGMAMRVTDDAYAASLSRFGFGERQGVSLPAESPGLFPALPWRESTQQTISYGYGLSVTPLQLNTATATIANGGVRMDPYLLAEIRDGRGNVLQRTEPREVERAVSERTARLTTRAMETVVADGGTALQAAIPGFQVAGKTGTAFLVAETGGYSEDYLSAFTGFVPAEDPVIAITVIVERPNPDLGFFGGTVAAPVFRALATEALVLEGLLPEPEPAAEDAIEALPAAEQACAADVAADAVPCWLGAWPGDVARQAAVRGWSVDVRGTGRVVAQHPEAGAAAPDDRIVHLVLDSAAEGR